VFFGNNSIKSLKISPHDLIYSMNIVWARNAASMAIEKHFPLVAKFSTF
jgi:hypothetical protein